MERNFVMVITWLCLAILSVQGLSSQIQNGTSVLKDERTHSPDGSFSYTVMLSDGTQIHQSGNPGPPSSLLPTTGTGAVNAPSVGGDDATGLVIRGEYTYVDPNGMTHKVTYVADKNGFQPQGDDIPQAHIGASAKNSSIVQPPPSSLNRTAKSDEGPLNTISSSLFSSPSGSL